jgi:molecular chaperone DnaK (HSP70)
MGVLYAIGIDFGTSNSCVTYASYFDRGNGKLDAQPLHRPEAITFHHRDTIPTVVFLGDGQDQPPMFGEMAEEKAPFYPELTRSGFKLHLGRPETGREAFLLAKQFLTYLRSRAGEFVPLDGSAQVETIVGHPVQWSADQREETRRAALEAGFPNVRLEEESLAALYSHVCEEGGGFQPRPGSRIFMVDMGGGTTDFAFLQIPAGGAERPDSIPVDPAGVVPAWGNGRRSYGGRDVDQLILEYLARDWEPEVVQRYRQSLLREARRFKEYFSNHIREGADRYETLWLVGDTPRKVRLTRQEFETFAAGYISHFETLLMGALKEGQLSPRQVTHLILTGGHSRWYFVDDVLKRVFPHLSVANRTILRHSHPEQSVARGLAFDPLIRSSAAGILAPVRRAAHALWLAVPTERGPEATAAPAEEPILLIPRGQQLPFQTRKPIRLRVEQMSGDAKEANLHIQFFSGERRRPLGDRVARFERGFFEQLSKAFRLPWTAREASRDQFEVLVACQVDEHELITAELLITRYLNGKAIDTQRQQMKLSTTAA